MHIFFLITCFKVKEKVCKKASFLFISFKANNETISYGNNEAMETVLKLKIDI